MEVNVCSNCKGKDYNELFVSDVNKIYKYISRKNIGVAMWGDHLLESVREKGFRDRKTSTGYEYQIPGAITPAQVKHEIPKDILMFNWFWGDENNDLALEKFGFKQVYGNFRPNISSWEKRSQWTSVLGGAPQNVYCYLGEPVECAQTVNDSKIFYSYEWKNPRFGKTIKHITLKGTDSFRNPYDKEIPENAIILLAINYTGKRTISDNKIK